MFAVISDVENGGLFFEIFANKFNVNLLKTAGDGLVFSGGGANYLGDENVYFQRGKWN